MLIGRVNGPGGLTSIKQNLILSDDGGEETLKNFKSQ